MQISLYRQNNSKYWWMRYTDNCNLVRKSTKCTKKKDAEKIVDLEKEKWLKAQGVKLPDSLTVEELCAEVEMDYEINGKKSRDRVKYSKDHLLAYLGKEKYLDEIDEKTINDYILFRKGEQAANGTINRELALLRRGFNILRLQGRILVAPTIKLLRETNVRTGFIEHWEYLKLLESASEHIKPIIEFVYKCGWRRSELINLQWKMVDLNNGIIMLPPQLVKNARGRVYYMDSEIKELFQRLWNEKTINKIDCPYVFLNRSKKGKINDFRKAWKNTCTRAGIGERYFHDMRRTAARNLIRSGVPERVAMQITGHLTRSTFERYNIVSDTDLKEAAIKQQKYLKNQPSKKQEEKEQNGLISGVVFKSNVPDADYLMWTEEVVTDKDGNIIEGLQIFGPELVKIKNKFTEKELKEIERGKPYRFSTDSHPSEEKHNDT